MRLRNHPSSRMSESSRSKTRASVADYLNIWNRRLQWSHRDATSPVQQWPALGWGHVVWVLNSSSVSFNATTLGSQGDLGGGLCWFLENQFQCPCFKKISLPVLSRDFWAQRFQAAKSREIWQGFFGWLVFLRCHHSGGGGQLPFDFLH